MAEVKPKKINLAFQGGGAHGAITWGVADRLLEDPRICIDAISGASAGAVNAAAVASGLHKGGEPEARKALDDIWKRVSDAGALYSPIRSDPFPGMPGARDFMNKFSYGMFDLATRALSPYQFNPFDINPLRDILEDSIDFESLRLCQNTKLYLAATNVRSGKVRVFNTSEVSTDVVCASACLPYLFKAVEIGGEHFWDGGYMGNPVLFPFFHRAESADIVIVHINPLYRDEVPTTPPEIMNRINEISFNSSLLRELRAISFVHKLLDEGWLKEEYTDRLRDVRVHSVRSDMAMVDFDITSKFRTDWKFLTDLKARGRDIADAWLQENFDKIGTESSVDLRAMFDGDSSVLTEKMDAAE
ncbi:MAG: patatin-like phospholipase family protein [Pseudomonadota bacterium]